MKFINKSGLIFETNDPVKIEVYQALDLQEWVENPQPTQEDVEVVDEYTVKKKAGHLLKYFRF